MKPAPRGQNDVAARPSIECRPDRLLNRLAAAGRPQDLLEPPAARLILQRSEQPLGGHDLQRSQGVVRSERRGREILAGPLQFAEAHVLEHAPPPVRRIVTQVGHQHAGREIGQLAAPRASSGNSLRCGQ